MTRSELEDLIKLHNESLDSQIEELRDQWRRLRFDKSSYERTHELKRHMDWLLSEHIELKESA